MRCWRNEGEDERIKVRDAMNGKKEEAIIRVKEGKTKEMKEGQRVL